MILPRNNEIWTDYAFCGWHSFNGNGEMTGIPWIDESGMLGSPVAITNTHQVGLVRDALVRYGVEAGVGRRIPPAGGGRDLSTVGYPTSTRSG